MRAGWWLVAVVVASLGASSCSPDQSASSPSTVPASQIAPSTVLNPSPGITVPFTADDGAFVVTAGAAPDTVTQDQAVAVAKDLLGSLPTAPQIRTVVAGRVTFAPGLTSDSVVERSAWIVVYTQESIGACVGLSTTPVAPASASNLQAIVVLGQPTPIGEDIRVSPAPVYDYLGAGLVVCYPSTQPRVLDLYQLYNGAR